MLKPYFLFFLVLFSCNEKSKTGDLNKVETVIQLQKQASSSPFGSNYAYLKKADEIIKSNAIIPDSLKAENDYLLGLYYKEKGNLDSASIYFYNATEHVQKHIHGDRQLDYFYESWYAYKGLERYGDCFAVSRRFKSLLREEIDFEQLAWCYFFDENTYKRLKDYPKALEQNELRVKMLLLTNSKLGLVRAYISQAELKYHHLDDKKASFAILDNLIEKEKELGLTNDHKRQLYESYGIFLYYEGDYEKALSYYLKALTYLKDSPDVINKVNKLATVYGNIAEVQIELKRYQKAKSYLDSIKILGFNNIGRRHQKATLKYQLRLSSLTNNDIGEVTRYLDTIYYYQDKVYADKYNTELVALTKANNNEKNLLKEKQASEIKALRFKSGLFLLLVLLSLITVLGILVYRQRKLKFEKQGLQMQQRLLRSQMNPHFTFNTLYAIQNLIKKDPEKSSNYLLKFSRLLRLILENSLNNYVQIGNELESLKKYMDLQLLRFPSKFEYKIVLEGIEEDEFLFIPPMLLQPFVENSIEHGFSSIKYTGEIIITLSLQNKYIQCIIEDNGIGLRKTNAQAKRSTSTLLISKFIEKVSQSAIEIYDKKQLSENQNGVLVKFLIPYNLNDND